jgi:histidinol-phosphate/aromatic aminotransferase/cobyric acid decarboxylase-like protein
MKANFETLLTQYPSGMKVNSLLAADNFGIKPEYMVIGNGAAELIKSFMSQLEGIVGIICPTFAEYANRYEKEKVIVYHPTSNDFHYGIDELIDFFDTKDIEVLVLINPDNPSGNFIETEKVYDLLRWADDKKIKVLVDESFVDFVDIREEQTIAEKSLLQNDILEKYKQLYVIKSISKSYGVPGIRLGVLASADEEMVQKLKKDVAIWNINSFGEFYMQTMEKYSGEYEKALQLFRECRECYLKELRKIDFLEVYDTQANYVLCEVKGRTSKDLCCELLKYNILIKDITSKIENGKQYISIAIRKQEDNERLIKVLRKIM